MFVFFMSLPFVKGDLVYKGLAGIFDHVVRFPGMLTARQPFLFAGEQNGYFVYCFVLLGFLFIMEIR